MAKIKITMEVETDAPGFAPQGEYDNLETEKLCIIENIMYDMMQDLSTSKLVKITGVHSGRIATSSEKDKEATIRNYEISHEFWKAAVTSAKITIE